MRTTSAAGWAKSDKSAAMNNATPHLKLNICSFKRR